MFPFVQAPQQRETLSLQVKNTTSDMNGQNLRLAVKNGNSSKTPGHHLSAAHGKEVVGRLVDYSSTQEGKAQLDLLLKSPRPRLQKEVELQQVRRPLTLAPLELPQKVREAQRQKLNSGQQETKPQSCKLDAMVNEACTRKAKSCVRQRLVKASVCPSEPLKVQHASSRPQLTRSTPIEQSGDRHLEDVVCRGTPAPLHNKHGLPSRAKALAACDIKEGQQQNSSSLLQDTGSRRMRLRRAQRLEEDQHNSYASNGGLSAETVKLAQNTPGKGRRAEGPLRDQPDDGKGIKQAPAASWGYGSIRRSNQEASSQQSAGCILNRQLASGGGNECALDGVKPSASNLRLKSKKTLIINHCIAVPR